MRVLLPKLLGKGSGLKAGDSALAHGNGHLPRGTADIPGGVNARDVRLLLFVGMNVLHVFWIHSYAQATGKFCGPLGSQLDEDSFHGEAGAPSMNMGVWWEWWASVMKSTFPVCRG